MMKLPEEPVMLLSFVNMKLRDQYASLDDLCDDLNVLSAISITPRKTALSESRPAGILRTRHARPLFEMRFLGYTQQ